MTCSLALAASFLSIPALEEAALDEMIGYLENEKVTVADGFLYTGPLLDPLINGWVLDLRDRLGPARMRQELMPLLDDPERYVAAHMALAHVRVGPRYSLGWAWAGLGHVEDPPPPKWKGRSFHYGLEWEIVSRKVIVEGEPDFVSVLEIKNPRQSQARLKRYWKEHFAGKRNDFRVEPVPPDDEDYYQRQQPPPMRPANDPLPLWETGEYPPLPPGLERPADVLFEISGQDDSLFNEPESEHAEEPSVP